MSVCYRSNCLSADLCHPNVVLPESARYLEGFWLVDFAKMALFKSYAVIYLAISAAMYEVLFVFYSYPNDDMEMATFDRTVLIVMALLTTLVWGSAVHLNRYKAFMTDLKMAS